MNSHVDCTWRCCLSSITNNNNARNYLQLEAWSLKSASCIDCHVVCGSMHISQSIIPLKSETLVYQTHSRCLTPPLTLTPTSPDPSLHPHPHPRMRSSSLLNHRFHVKRTRCTQNFARCLAPPAGKGSMERTRWRRFSVPSRSVAPYDLRAARSTHYHMWNKVLPCWPSVDTASNYPV